MSDLGNPVTLYLQRMAAVERDERRRIELVLRRGARPSDAGEGIHPMAPARGVTQLFRHSEVIRTEQGNFRIRRTTGPGTEAGGHALRRADAFDVMEAQSARAAKARNREPVRLFTQAQVEAGRAFGEVSERVAKGGIKCSSIDGARGGGDGFMDAYIADCQRLERMRRAIGDGWALSPMAAAPHRGHRQPIRSRAVVYFVCVGGLTMADVLARFGWSRGQKAKDRLRSSFAASLDAIYGI